MHTIHCVCSPCHLHRWDRLQLGFPEGRLWRRGGWLHAEQGQPQPGRSLSFRLITITSPWCFCHLSLRFCRLSLGYYHEDVCGLCRTHMYEECPSHIYLKYLCGVTRILLFLIIVIILEKIFSSFFPFLAVNISLCVSLSVLLHYNHHGNYHHCLVLRWPCAVDRALKSNYQLITVTKLFICWLQYIPCMDFYLIHNNVNCISPPPFQRSAWPSPSAWSRWTFLWPCRWPTRTRREVSWVISMASRAMTSSSPTELCWAATWQRGRSSKCSAVNVSSHNIHYMKTVISMCYVVFSNTRTVQTHGGMWSWHVV